MLNCKSLAFHFYTFLEILLVKCNEIIRLEIIYCMYVNHILISKILNSGLPDYVEKEISERRNCSYRDVPIFLYLNIFVNSFLEMFTNAMFTACNVFLRQCSSSVINHLYVFPIDHRKFEGLRFSVVIREDTKVSPFTDVILRP